MTDLDFMQLALKAARRGIGHTWTNPVVGAVIVRDGQCIATGYHHRYGKDHAEVNALKQLPDIAMARGATMYVTLEPCSHFGKTPPCARRLVEVGIQRVVIGQEDRNPLVHGKGIAILRDAGIQVDVLGTTGELNAAYNFFYTHQRPLVTAKYAMSLDGKINAAGNTRTQLTGDAAVADAMTLRRNNQAILVGENTVMVDNLLLTVREPAPDFAPIRIVLVGDADKLSQQLRLFHDHGPIWLLSRHATSREWPANVTVKVDAQWSVAGIVDALQAAGIQSLLVEGGSHVHAQFFAAGLVDAVQVYVAPVVLGGTALPAVSGIVSQAMQSYQLSGVTQLGQDCKLTYRR
ncbi:bifunctional diaminohydroxyphosphoribosylaminopyrimidine deaminase/5-amino-6-(5-phosphoribosylamino)uracil reductase RibD [Lacticaseibacillus pabuli]|uniref:Riboflavin biosynthesis protein RibD n=1 Tax=Lacticaseibacillus pabuli TaxID=3025672 RepID=A0ABY7WUV0_9LACO|nr:bifunctional diaminohydroxyphosphoribosylaminopyrimidine deaminase/5-amino-6-(5-phosphoribosylamino)uracil reductase RibD [Lacticaseibacillus sp. KACC 23028]WDF83258.1 bifunctional diaminohydroxyphosphoribosylaminopyrimidine deaminase/5-amino-6-(5-phosphoribosylamino)uracil reductase RibD [Lacticaseibacillus sp. KACC 23028]